MKILIAETSDIIRTGIRYILHELDKNQIVIELYKHEKLKKTIEREKPYLIFISDVLLIKTFDLKAINKIKEHCILVEIQTDLKETVSIYFQDFINFYTKKADILNILQKYTSVNTEKLLKMNHEKILSDREIEVVKEIANGLSNKEIAEKLFLSVHTVITHRKNITQKLGIKTAQGLTVYAIINNIIEIN